MKFLKKLSAAIVVGNYATAITAGYLDSSKEATVAGWTDGSVSMKLYNWFNLKCQVLSITQILLRTSPFCGITELD